MEKRAPAMKRKRRYFAAQFRAYSRSVSLFTDPVTGRAHRRRSLNDETDDYRSSSAVATDDYRLDKANGC